MELIISQRLAPGAHLIETDIARQLQVSRQPVREALQSLQADGWVDLRPGRGAFVHQPTVDEVDEVFAVRIVLEEQAVRLAARRATAADVEALRAVCVRGRVALEADDASVLADLNSQLHQMIAELANNRVLATFISALDSRIRWYYTAIARRRGSESWHEHDELIDALEAHDSTRAARLMRAHTSQSQRAFHQLHTEMPA